MREKLEITSNSYLSLYDYGDHTYYPYIGVGAIQLTSESAYISFAIYKAIEAYPQLAKELNYDPIENSSAHINYDSLNDLYGDLEKITNNKIDISPYKKIFEENKISINMIEKEIEKVGKGVNPDTNERVPLIGDSTYYTAKYFPWETAGYFWMINEIGEVLNGKNEEKKVYSGKEAIECISNIVNSGMTKEESEKRIAIYNEILKKDIIKLENEKEIN